MRRLVAEGLWPTFARRQEGKIFRLRQASFVGGGLRPDVTPKPWAIPWLCLHEFLAVVTHPRIFWRPTPLRVARVRDPLVVPLPKG